MLRSRAYTHEELSSWMYGPNPRAKRIDLLDKGECVPSVIKTDLPKRQQEIDTS